MLTALTDIIRWHNLPKDVRMRVLATMSLTVVALVGSWIAEAVQPALTITGGGHSREFTTAALLARKDTVSLVVQLDASYGRSMTYRAVPLLALLDGTRDDRSDTLEARAKDGFTAQIPLTLVIHGTNGGAVAWLAVEDPTQPWPPLPHRAASAGPFYLVWDHPERSGVSSEQWPYALTSLTLAESPVHRWPQLELPAARLTDSAARSGQKVFFSFCLPCHRLNGGGAGQMGPDLGRPMNATQYLTDAGLRAIIRNPGAVRTWPGQRMTGFDARTLPEADLGDLLIYLRAMAGASVPAAVK
jgi:mono/diheme cytochrome c family protein